ncbi:MAG TPA: VWA domain-containing protein [Methylibium sp.]
MTWLWPGLLWWLVLLPLLVLLYVLLQRRRRRHTLRYASLSLVKDALGRGSGWRRHVPPFVMLLALAALLLATARPAAVVTLPSQQETIILAMDVSGSMRATDVEPSRLVASQNAAKAFIATLPRHVRVGVVAFAGTAAVVQAPTLSREDVVAAIDRFQLQRGTAIGSGIVLALAALLPDAGIDLAQITGDREPGLGDTEPRQAAPVAPGSYDTGAIILLTDGQRTTGPDPMDAAKLAANHGVRVYTVGFGTVNGEVIGFEGWSMRVRLDEEALKAIATVTHAEYFYAGSARDLQRVYDTLSSRLVFEKKETEITALFAALGAALALLAAGLSLWWFGRVM